MSETRKEVIELKDCETTITIDIKKLPEEYRTGDINPFSRLDAHQLSDVEDWVCSLIPGHEVTYCAEIIGKMPNAVAMKIGSILESTGCQKLTRVIPGTSMLVIWDYTRGDN